MSKNESPKGDLLVEFFSEEIPARMQVASGKQLENLLQKNLVSRNISFNSFKTYTGPRHLAIIIRDIDLIQKNQLIEKRGPRLGSDEKAVNGFLKSNNISLSETIVKKTNNGDFYFYSQNVIGANTAKILPDIINEIIYGFVWSKSQRWAYSDLKWARPLRNILILLNDELVDGKIKIGNNTFLEFTNYTFGHRHNEQKIIVKNINEYERLLHNNNVILDRNIRKDKILSDMNLILNKKQLHLKQDDTLLDEITGLVEFPNVMLGSIDISFMSLPPEVLSTTMKVHQKYFSIIDDKNNLAAKFLFISNSILEKNRDLRIVEGNERVLRARLADASFFWKVDTSNTFEYWNKKLKKVLFYEGLGSLFDKTIRMSQASSFFSIYFKVDNSLAIDAALSSKADLVSEMVGEFPELQGIMGGYYSKLNGKPTEVSVAISEQYKPKGLLDEMPQTDLGALLSMVDKIDTLTGFFVINKKPTGSKDPFALRRAGFSIVQILIQFKLNISLDDLFTESLKTFNNLSQSIKTDLIDFIIDKLRFILKSDDFRDDIVESVLSLPDIHKLGFQVIYRRIQNISLKIETEDFKFFLSNFKRLNNILKTNDAHKNYDIPVDVNLFQSLEEEQIDNFTKNLILKNNKYKNELESQELYLKKLISSNNIINLFFENTKVNHEITVVKQNRFILLVNLRKTIMKYSCFSKIED